MLMMFILLTVANVVIQTVKSIVTIKCGKTVAAVVNALAYGIYTYVIFYTSSDFLPLWGKALITAVCNLLGVWIVKYIEEKNRKDKLWKVEITIPNENREKMIEFFDACPIPYNYNPVGKWTAFNCYCATKKQSAIMVEIAKEMNGKYCAFETAPLV